jgi:hypothetical protein
MVPGGSGNRKVQRILQNPENEPSGVTVVEASSYSGLNNPGGERKLSVHGSRRSETTETGTARKRGSERFVEKHRRRKVMEAGRERASGKG